MRRVGILGGMGPEATVLLMQKLLRAVPATDDADHIPLIVDQNPQVPSRIAYLIDGTGSDPAPTLAAMAANLQRAGAQAIAMPCNTAHHFAPEIRAAITVPFLDMVQLSIAQALRAGGPVGILASPAVQKVGLFDKALAGQGGHALYPSDQSALLDAIRTLKSVGPNPAARATLQAASDEVQKKGAAIQMIACTEFSLLAADLPQAFDTLDVLVKAITDFATNPTKAARGRPNTEQTGHA